ncbi:MAG: hypothetical protein HYX68_27665 [Planctomycetes bacterium]|nr:hypothetical protein [Planctomycetota bacterium]
MLRWILSLLLFLASTSLGFAQSTHRLQDGITAFVNNTEGKDFNVHLAVRDLNLFETGARELLVKVYDPAGRPVVRKVIPDDGVVSKAFLPPIGAWDHEAWYYAYCYMKGTQPMIRWSAFSEPDRLASVAKRDFKFAVKGAKKGVYRVLVVGCIDHYVTLKMDPAMPHAIAGHPDWIHGHGKQWQKSYVYVPRGSVGMFATFAEYDAPRQRTVIVRGPDGKQLITGKTGQIFWKDQITFEKPGKYDDQVLTVEVGPGPGDFLLGLKFRLERSVKVNFRGERVAPAVYAPDVATARAVRGGAIYHDGEVFWHGFQVRFHDWLKKIPASEFEVTTKDGKPADPAAGYLKTPKNLIALPTRPNFLPVNGVHWRAPACDVILHNYPAHKNKAALNVALRDLQRGLRVIGPHDHVANAAGGPFANMAYEFGNYAWHYWRPAWRILRQSDAPDEVKAIVHEAFLVTGDRLAFCRTWERVNGNSYAQVLTALRYAHEATNDPLQKELFETYWQRFTTGGWGERVGVGPSGPIQEGFGYAFHYASYILTTWKAIRADFPDDKRFAKVHDGVHRWFSYTYADERVPAGPWSTRTSFYPEGGPAKDGPFAWKGLPGPAFTDSVNNADEFFAARRKNYYALTYHGRLSPKWESNAHPGQSGYGGGMLCQLQIPGKGLAIASTLNKSYGEDMDISLWRNFHLHTLAGIQADGAPFVSGDSEHADAKLKQNVVVSSGDIRNTPLHVRRTFAFKDQEIACSVQLDESGFGDLLSLWLKNNLRGRVREAYEMIPFQPNQRGKKGATIVALLDAQGNPGKVLDKEPTEAAGVLIDRGGFGVRIVFDKARPVMRGNNNTVMIRLADKVVAAKDVSMSYRLVPFGN